MGQPVVTIGGKEVFAAPRPAGGTHAGETRPTISLAIAGGILLIGLIGLLILLRGARSRRAHDPANR